MSVCCVYRDDEHCTALMLSAARGHVAVMKILLDNHASVNDTDKMKVRHADVTMVTQKTDWM